MSTRAKKTFGGVAAGIVLGILIGALSTARADFPHFPAKATGSGSGLPSIPNNETLCNISGGSATPSACTAANLVTAGLTQSPSAVAITGGSITGTTISGNTIASGDILPGWEQEYFVKATDSTHSTWTLSGLNGNADGTYALDIQIISNAGSNNLKIQVNGADSNLNAFSSNLLVGGAAVSGSWSIAQASQNPATFSSSDVIRLRCTLSAKVGGFNRFLTCLGYGTKGGSFTAWNFMGFWADTTNNLTSLSIVASASSGIQTGSFIYAYRIPTSTTLQ